MKINCPERDQEIFVLKEQVRKLEQSKELFLEFMGIHGSIYNEEKWLEAKRRHASVNL